MVCVSTTWTSATESAQKLAGPAAPRSTGRFLAFTLAPDPPEIPVDHVGVDFGSIVELDPLANVEGDLRRVRRGFPSLGKRGYELRRIASGSVRSVVTSGSYIVMISRYSAYEQMT